VSGEDPHRVKIRAEAADATSSSSIEHGWGRARRKVMIRRQPKGSEVKVTFAIPTQVAPKRVSVVGDFNEWTPGTHTLVKRANGTHSVSVTVPKGSSYRFRYLGEGGQWFDDPEADAHTHEGGILHV
jgi:1,4-alpha-glucan branching enzyme